MKKHICLCMSLFISAVLTLSTASISFAAGWTSDSVGWWYDNGDGSYKLNEWFADSNGKYYYFGPDGYMLHDTTTPDGYQVGADGAWIQGGASQQSGSMFSISGRGDYVTGTYTISEPARVHVENSGDRHFSVWAHEGGGSKDLLANTVGDYDGSTFLKPGIYFFEVKSSGRWSISAEPLGSTSDNSFSGHGCDVTPVFTSSGAYSIGGDSDSNFIVWGFYDNGNRRDLLVNTIGSYSGTILFNRGAGSFFEITADGGWTIRPQ